MSISPTSPPLDSQAPASGRTVAIILCAGQGTRMGAGMNKVFLPVAGRPLLTYTLDAFTQAGVVDALLLVAHPQEVVFVEREIVQRFAVPQVIGVVAGGASRHQSEERALAALRPRIEAGELATLLIHDGARPFVTPAEIEALVGAARARGGALLATALGADEALLQVAEDGATVLAAHAPDDLWRAQTPQAFDARRLLAAYDLARAEGFEGTDTAASYERLGLPVALVPGSERNFKVTTPDDLLRAEALLRE